MPLVRGNRASLHCKLSVSSLLERQEVELVQVGIAECAELPPCFLKLKNAFLSPANVRFAVMSEAFSPLFG